MATDANSVAVLLTHERAAEVEEVSFSRPWRTIGVLAVGDICAVIIALALGSLMRNYFLHSNSMSIIGTVPLALMLVVFSFLNAGLYTGVSLDPVEELQRLSGAVMVAFLALLSATYLNHDLSLSRAVFVGAWVLCLFLVPMGRAFTRAQLSRQSWWGSPVAILGYGSTGRLMLKKLQENPGIGLRPFAVLDDNEGKLQHLEGAMVTGALGDCREIAANHKLAYGIVCMPQISRDQLLALMEHYGRCFGHVVVIPNLIGMSSLGIKTRNIGGIVGLEVRQELLRPSSRRMKRLLDVAITLALAPLILPLLAVAALAVVLDSRGSVFYRCERVGLGGRTFRAWKIRSMMAEGNDVLREYLDEHPEERANWNRTQKLKRDPRVTSVGRILRKTSIDELPQFWNVLRGEMSVVGPRPIQEDQIEMYGPSFGLYQQVRPGVTGLWQVSGRNNLAFSERVNLDRYVIQNWSVWLDVYVIALTVGVVLTGDGAY